MGQADADAGRACAFTNTSVDAHMKCVCVRAYDVCDLRRYIGSQARTNPSREDVSAPSLHTASQADA